MSDPDAEAVSLAGGSTIGLRDGIVEQVDTFDKLDVIMKDKKRENPQKTIDEFWQNFRTKHPGQVVTVLPDNLYAKRAAALAPKGIVPGHNAVASYEDAVAICKDKVDKITRGCRRINQKYRDVHFDIEWDLKSEQRDCLNGLTDAMFGPENKPGSVNRVEDMFENPRFYIDGTTAGDVKQGRDGDCWFLAALCTLSNMEGLIPKVCVAKDEQVGVYGFVFHRDGEWISTIIDDKLYLIKPDYDDRSAERYNWDDLDRTNSEEEFRRTHLMGSRALYFAQCSDPNETWLPLLEKAYAKAHGDFSAIDGGFVGEAIEDLTGGVTTEILSSDILDKDRFWREELMKVNQDFLFGCFTGLFGRGNGKRDGVIEMHAYSVMKVVEMAGERLVLLRNPWHKTEWNGPWSDGSKEWTPTWMERLNHQFGDDGAFWISYKDLIRKYQHFDRTRLFGPDWTVTQQWTSLNVPWSVDYHETKFSLELKKAGPVVIVLSQLDNRYFRGLHGQYDFELQFRVHKEGDKQYLVRSNGYYCMRRSVSAEIDLEPGRYSILLKIIASREKSRRRPEEVIRLNCDDKREKLLQIGLSYDLAHAKGRKIETEAELKRREERTKRKKEERRKKNVELYKKARKENKTREKKSKRKQKQKERKKEKKAKEKAQRKEAKRAAKAQKSKADVSKDEESKVGEQKTEDAKAELLAVDQSNGPHTTSSSSTSANGNLTPASSAAGDSPAKETAGDEIVTPTPTPAPASAPAPSVDDDDDDDESLSSSSDSDADTDFSDIEFITVVDDSGRTARRDDANPPAPAKVEEEDEFVKDPWNAVCTVGLRVYSKDKEVSVQVVQPNEEEDESTLDLDDTAADAAVEGKADTQTVEER
ncbi:MAG: hypothetical protein M4579_000394 [Chaenotheca gracillima]|nr:MAG: hypothetical protein M4579_000394 [Chaenotheca gracillima]